MEFLLCGFVVNIQINSNLVCWFVDKAEPLWLFWFWRTKKNHCVKYMATSLLKQKHPCSGLIEHKQIVPLAGNNYLKWNYFAWTELVCEWKPFKESSLLSVTKNITMKSNNHSAEPQITLYQLQYIYYKILSWGILEICQIGNCMRIIENLNMFYHI